MLNSAGEPQASWLRSIADQATAEWMLMRGVDEDALHRNVLALYAASYALIRVGNVVAEHSRDLEIIYPNCDWVDWVILRNSLAHQPDPAAPLNPREVWVAVSRSLPELVSAITGQPPP